MDRATGIFTYKATGYRVSSINYQGLGNTDGMSADYQLIDVIRDLNGKLVLFNGPWNLVMYRMSHKLSNL